MTEKHDDVSLIEAPPHTIWGILQRLGPGLIIAGSIVGSGELIGTTTTGAQAGYYLLWLIIIGCVIKVFVQVEFGRYTISNSQAAMVAMNEVPGPAISWGAGKGGRSQKANWMLLYWVVMFVVSLGQLGGIVGGVGQAMAISTPLTDVGREFNEAASARAKKTFEKHLKAEQLERAADDAERQSLTAVISALDAEIKELTKRLEGDKDVPGDHGLTGRAHDHQIWAAVITVATCVLLVIGKYGFIQWASTFMVAAFTLVTVVNVFMLQSQPEWAVTWNDIWTGLQFSLPPAKAGDDAKASLFTALATFGIIGVGANELISYPYWCLEKGYARFAGPRDGSQSWLARARGWMRVMRWDAWCSMVVYTFATIAFYLLGAAILGRLHLTPKSTDMIRTLSIMYEPVFGGWTTPVFLFGAWAVLYSTFFVAIAGHARVCADAMRIFTTGPSGPMSIKAVKWFSGIYPVVSLLFYLVYPEPKTLVLASGAMQVMMLPMLSVAALYFRYCRTDVGLRPGKVWDICLWVSAVGMLIAGVSALYVSILKMVGAMK